MLNKLLLGLLILTSIPLLGQQEELPDMSLQKLKKIDQNPVQVLVMTTKKEFKVVNVNGDFTKQKQFLKSYILIKKAKANIELDRKKHPDFESYRTCSNQVNSIYTEIWNELAKEKFKKDFSELETDQKQEIITEYPVKFK